MMILYNIGIWFYTLAIHIAALFNGKARLWVKGRKGWKEKLSSAFVAEDRVFWFHCASLGEFEQGRPAIEAIKEKDPGIKILLTFYSPSGYEIRKNYKHASLVMYLPSDRPGNVKAFLNIIKPEKVIFIKYEFWFNYIRRIQDLQIPLYLVSGIFRPGHYFFKAYGKKFLRMLAGFTHLFVQDQQSEQLLRERGLINVSLSGDTRFDRVFAISQLAEELDLIKVFKGNSKLVIGGSTWHPDEEIICRYINVAGGDEKWIIAPHEIGEAHLAKIENLLEVSKLRYSKAENCNLHDYKVLIIDNIGLLSSAYRYGDMAVIGGGFGKGIHNVLEPASWGLPVLFGPNHVKFREALDLLSEGGAFSFGSYDEFSNTTNSLLGEKKQLSEASDAARTYVKSKLGATAIVLNKIL